MAQSAIYRSPAKIILLSFLLKNIYILGWIFHIREGGKKQPFVTSPQADFHSCDADQQSRRSTFCTIPHLEHLRTHSRCIIITITNLRRLIVLSRLSDYTTGLVSLLKVWCRVELEIPLSSHFIAPCVFSSGSLSSLPSH